MEKEKREKIFNENKNLVYYAINKYYSNCKDKEDLIQEGFVGLLRAIDTFGMSYGVQFQTYAMRCIINNINDFVRKNKTINTRSKNNNVQTISIYSILNDDENKGIMLCDTISCGNNIEYFELVNDIKQYINSIENKKQKEVFAVFLENKKIYGNAKEKQIKKQFNISKSTMYRIIHDNLEKLKKELQ